MPQFSVVVEGFGDVVALPPLLARTGNSFGIAAFTSNPPIRVKGLTQLVRDGELERWILLAQSRPNIDGVIFVIDVDENCPVEIRRQFESRVESMGSAVRVPVHFCLIETEFESWFLADVDTLKSSLPEYGWIDDVNVVNHNRIRGAKEALDRLFVGMTYKETRDQEIMARKVSVKNLYSCDRSFRRFAKCVTGLSYEDMEFIAAT